MSEVPLQVMRLIPSDEAEPSVTAYDRQPFASTKQSDEPSTNCSIRTEQNSSVETSSSGFGGTRHKPDCISNCLALDFTSIDLLDEVREEFYVELPIAIEATGSYHDLGAFISGMAGLPRIVTLHDFDIEMSGDDSSNLSMKITVKTYRYRDGNDVD